MAHGGLLLLLLSSVSTELVRYVKYWCDPHMYTSVGNVEGEKAALVVSIFKFRSSVIRRALCSETLP